MPATLSANKTQYLFLCGDLEEDTFRVISFNGTDKISTPYHFTVILKSLRDDIEAEDLINRKSSLYLLHQYDSYSYSGVVFEFEYLGTEGNESIYKVVMVPRLKLIEMNSQTRVFLNMSVPEIIQKVLDDAALTDYYELTTNDSYPQRESVLQYQESDLNFISRLMEEVGIFYFFSEDPHDMQDPCTVKGEKLVITDTSSSFSSIPGDPEIIFRTQSGQLESSGSETLESVNKLVCKKRAVQRAVMVKNYNYRTPEINLSAHKKIDRGIAGTVYNYGTEFSDIDGAEQAAGVVADRIVSNSADVSGESTSARFRAGLRFDLEQHKRQKCNDNYLIYSVFHTGGHNTFGTGALRPTYANKFTAVSSELVENFRPKTNAHIPKVSGVISAMVETNGSQYASLDEMGRYKVRMPFDVSGTPNSEASKPVRLAQPYSGANYGIHFPSHEGTELIMACIDGNPNRPVALGTVPNANNVSPVSSNNCMENIIRTAGKNEILLDDTEEKQKIKIKTAALNSAVLDDENRQLFLQTTDGNKVHLDDENECASWNAGKNNISMSYKSGEEGIVITTANGNIIRSDDENKCITIQTSAGHCIQLDDDAGTIVLADSKGKNSVTLDGSDGLILDSKGEITIKAMKDINIEGQNINLSSTPGEINVKATQDLSLEGLKLNQKATTDVAIEGMNTSIKANMNASMEGNLGAEVKSGVQTKISGTMTEVSGDAINTLKGGMVMIN
ncbi:type VI secretion system tip protein TssI/VgrG [Chitinispirillales bacterium ANBcel5]|uniref:type VI secretion system Vgr family protein n=1 Tax=Cellulosispirillum alkaliphilum TaxID=3039283 RepID=UPI002A56BEDC|nr:type VI secretion system tip protein TssI/VgrG [Chitinispirillales bacterium ANBcel5]